MKPIITINWQVAPKEWKRFQKWHAAACPSDPLTAEERFLKEGGVIDDHKRAKGKK